MNDNPYVDRHLLEQAMEVSGESDASTVLTQALEEFIARRSPKRILELMGKLEWDESYDRKRERSRN
jgi:hypothetical protein